MGPIGHFVAHAITVSAIYLAVLQPVHAQPKDITVLTEEIAKIETEAVDWSLKTTLRYAGLRATLNDRFLQAPDTPFLQEWMQQGWLLQSPGAVVQISAFPEPLEMDKALWFADFILAPWGFTRISADPCLATAAFKALADPRNADPDLVAALPAVAEASRLNAWASNSRMHTMITGKTKIPQAELDHAMLTSFIMGDMLIGREPDPRSFVSNPYMDIVTGRPFTRAEIDFAIEQIEQTHLSAIGAAFPYFERLQSLFTKSGDQAVAELCKH